jgi:hypothetical protein
MLRLDRVIKPWKEAAALNSHINLYGFWNQTTFLTKSGDLGVVLHIPGMDYESLDHGEQEYAVKRLEAALKAFDPGFHVYQYLFKHNRPEIPFASYPIVAASIEQRRQFFEAKRDRLYQIELFYCILLEGARSKMGFAAASGSASMILQAPSPQQLVEWMANPAEIDRRAQGTEMASMIAKSAQQQCNGVLAPLGLIADSLRMLPTTAEATRSWSATEPAENRQGWIFITSTASEREALRPLQGLWIDLLVLRLLNEPKEDQHPVWFVLDQLASLQRLPQPHTAITENRKSKNPLVLGFQGKAQFEVICGHLAEVILSQPATKVFLKTTESKAAKWVSNAIGKVEVERVRETHFDGTRAGKNDLVFDPKTLAKKPLRSAPRLTVVTESRDQQVQQTGLSLGD